MNSTRTPCGITVVASSRVADGTFVYWKAGRIVALSTLERREWLALFGLRQEIPSFDAVTLSTADYAALTKDEPSEVPFQ